MAPNTTNHWKTDPEYIKLKHFLIEKTKDAESPLSIKQLAEEFKENSGASQGIGALRCRANAFRGIIHELDLIDTERKVRMMVALSASVDKNFLKELRKDAEVSVDKCRRITKYRAKDGSLELTGDHSMSAKQKMRPKIDWENNPEHIESMNFLIEKTKDAESPMNINQLAREFKEKSEASQGIRALYQRITTFRGRIHELNSIDTERKVRMLVALGGSVDENFLKELRNDADVKVDGENRITKYRAKDGSLELEGDHCKSAKMKDVQKRKMGSKADSIPNTPGSTKRTAPEMPNLSKRTKTGEVKSKDSAPDDSARIPSREQDSSNLEVQLLRQPKLEEAPEESGAQEAPIFRSHGAPGADIPRGPPNGPKNSAARPRQEAPTFGAHIPRASQIKTESEADGSFTSQIKLLEAMKFLIFPLAIPSSSGLRARIQKKLRKLSPNAKIPNDEMSLAMGLMVAKITNHSVSILSENVKSVRLSHFLCYLNAAIMNSELKGLEDLLEKISGRIKEPASKDKNIPVEKLASVLQETLMNIGI